MNALARVPAGVALDDCTLWSSLEPCLMCLSSALLSSVGEALAAHDLSEPEIADLVRRWVTDRTLADLASTGATVEEVLATVWDDLTEAARGRAIRQK